MLQKLLYKPTIESLFRKFGIRLDGATSTDINVHDESFYKDVFLKQSIGFGESYMQGAWDCDDLAGLFRRIYASNMSKKDYNHFQLGVDAVRRLFQNQQNKTASHKVNVEHYDIDNSLYEKMLDGRMVYTCGFWEGTTSLDTAQKNKMDMICRKLNLKPGDKLLDIGCGFGSFLKYAAENYGVLGTGVTLSKNQWEFAKENCKSLPIEIKFCDYRDFESNEKFDAISSIGMFEAVGPKNFKKYMSKMKTFLADDGLFVLHTIGNNQTKFQGKHWVDKYIFPNGYIPSMVEITKSSEGIFLIEDVHNIGPHYEKTLLAWHQNLRSSWDQLSDTFDEKFKRMWDFYLLSFAGGFSVGNWQVWQIVFSANRASTDHLHRMRIPNG